LALWLFLSFSAAWFGSRFEPGLWFAELQKPAWNPPSWVFGPVWTVLYLMMGIAAWLVWLKGGIRAQLSPLLLFLLQLLLNGLWSWIFFGLQRPGLALIDIVALWILIGLTTVAFWRTRRAAGLLFIPYWLWVTFATALNFEIWRLN
jgi:translocator protein